MRLATLLRKVGLLMHVIASVGWFGAVCVFMCLSMIGLTADDPQTVRGAYRMMEATAKYTLVPFALGALLTGVVQSLTTHWGLFQHYWVVLKLVLTAVSTMILVVYMKTFKEMAAIAADESVALEVVRNPSPLLHATLALIVLAVATVLAVFKPSGWTRYGWRRRQNQHSSLRDVSAQP